MRIRLVRFEPAGIAVKTWRGVGLTVSFEEILTAERLTHPRRGIRLHTRNSDRLTLSCGAARLDVENELREHGVRVVDCWGCIIAPTLLDFEEELAREPVRMRQSSDSA